VSFARRSSQPVTIGAAIPPEAGVTYGSSESPADLGEVTFAAVTVAWTSQDIAVDQFECLAIDLTKGTVTTNVSFVVKRKGADGVYYTIASSALQTAAGANSTSVGQGVQTVADVVAASSQWSQAVALSDVIQIVLTPTGAFTGTLSVKGK
jgi:hypothetical protein